MKHHIFIIAVLIAAIIMPMPAKAGAIDLPDDMPTIEALISLHKLIKKEEDKAMEKVAASYGEQSLVTKGAKAFNDVRTTLDTKLNNAYSYLILGTALASTGTDLYALIRDYTAFTKNATKYTFKKPAIAWYYYLFHKSYSGGETYWKWSGFKSGLRVRFKEHKSNVKTIMPTRIVSEETQRQKIKKVEEERIKQKEVHDVSIPRERGNRRGLGGTCR